MIERQRTAAAVVESTRRQRKADPWSLPLVASTPGHPAAPSSHINDMICGPSWTMNVNTTEAASTITDHLIRLGVSLRVDSRLLRRAGCLCLSPDLRFAASPTPYSKVMTTTRLRGSRTPLGVGTGGWRLPTQRSSMRPPATPSCCSWARTASARRCDSPIL